MKPADAWASRYQSMAVVQHEKVIFEQFHSAFTRHKKQIGEKKKASIEEEELLKRHRELHPTTSHAQLTGKRHFYLTKAQKLLEADILAGLHKKTSPADLQASRQEYQAFDKDIFRQRIYQEVRAERFKRYLNDDREAKQKAMQAVNLEEDANSEAMDVDKTNIEDIEDNL